jgi:hypothetical protein
LRFPPIGEYFAGELIIEEGPRDRAVRIRSKKTLVKTRGESAKELAFADGPFGRSTKEFMPKVAEGLAKVLRPVGECLNDVERFSEREDTRQSQQKLLPNSMAGS